MTLAPGMRMGAYEVVAPLGSGGMGDVYRARDVRLGRDVALKILPHHLTADADSLARFEREARTLASLTHPNIATIHGIEETATGRALVLELVEGETLAERLAARRALPLAEALAIARQIADGLDAAHERGIVHRDLKPSNVMLATGAETASGGVKLLDFGIAKTELAERESATAVTMARTQAGVIVGTTAYMSPEQARGQAVDKRTDVWAFGCVLFEMLSGRSPFAGATASDSLAAVIEREPDWRLLGAGTPPRIRRLLRRCLVKDMRRRLRDIGDARLELDDAGADDDDRRPVPAAEGRTRSNAAALAAVFAVVGLAAGWLIANRSASPLVPPVARVSITVAPADGLLGAHQMERSLWGRNRPSRTAIALAPSGDLIAFTATRGGVEQLYVRRLDEADASPLPGTEGADGPFFSPDGRWIGFWADGGLRRVGVDGSGAIKLCDSAQPAGASWGSDDSIVFAQRGTIWRVPGAGGAPVEITRRPEEGTETRHLLPQLLPGGDWLLFTVLPTGNDWTTSRVVVQSTKTGERTVLVEGAADGRYVPTGHLVYMKLGSLMGAPFDAARHAITGGEFVIQRGVMHSVNSTVPNNLDTGAGQVSFSASGTLAYVGGGVHPDYQGQPQWIDRSGVTVDVTLPGPPRPYFLPRLSPDGRQLAVGTLALDDQSLWRYDFATGTFTRLTTEGRAEEATWSPDGRRIAFALSLNGYQSLYAIPADGSARPERLFTGREAAFPGAWTPDGQTFVFSQAFDIKTLDLSGGQTPRAIIESRFVERIPALSTDGRWLAYVSNETGQNEIYVQPFPGPGGKRLISTNGGTEPVWSRDGRTLTYIVESAKEHRVMQVAVNTGASELAAGTPRQLFVLDPQHYSGAAAAASYDVNNDGSRIIIIRETFNAGVAPREIQIVQNWFSELRRHSGTR